MNNLELDPSVEVVHLRRLLDTQPCCLMRLGADGTVLAANDAALMMLGERSPAQALGRDFALWIPPDQHDRWRAFTLGVVHGSPSSIECDVAGPSGARFPTLFHAVPLADHPDGVASMAVTARVISAQRQLEAAIGELTERLRERDAEIQAREAALATAEGARRAADESSARARAEVQQLEMALNEFANRQRTGTDSGRSRLEAAVQQAQQALARSEQREQEAGAERDALQRRLEQALVAGQDREAELRRLQAAHEDLVATHLAATTERDRLVTAVREQAAHMEALANGIRGTLGSPVAAGAAVESPVGRGGRSA